MTQHKVEELSYATIDWRTAKASEVGLWNPEFDAGRCLVYTKLGPYRRLFEKPAKFTKRFYHTLYPLSIEHWQLTEQLTLFEGFCSVAVELIIQFQATLPYVQNTELDLLEVNAHIKSVYEVLVRDIVQEVLLNLTDGAWVKVGLASQEQAIELAVNELFLAQDIQAHCLCQLSPHFAAYPDLKFKEESVYFMAMKKNFEMVREQQQQQFFHEQELERQKLEQKQQRLTLLQNEQALDLQAEGIQAEYQKKRLLETEAQIAERRIIEKRLHAEKEKHESDLHALTLLETLRRKENQEALERDLELKTLNEKLSHQLTVKEQQLAANIKAFELKKAQWATAKAKWQKEEARLKQRQEQLDVDIEPTSKLSVSLPQQNSKKD